MKHITIDTNTSHEELFCFDNQVSLENVANKLESELGLKLMAHTPTDTVDGCLSAIYSSAEAQGQMWCDSISPEGQEHTCVAVMVYGETREPEADDSRHPRTVRRSKLRAKTLTSKQKTRMHNLLTKEKYDIVNTETLNGNKKQT